MPQGYKNIDTGKRERLKGKEERGKRKEIRDKR
jgi:hypothetical protein